ALLTEFHWSRTGLAGVFSLYAFTYCVVGFPAGRLTDRWGPRVVIACGALFLGAALVAMAGVTALWQAYVLYAVAAIGMGTAYVPCNTTVVRWFARRRDPHARVRAPRLCLRGDVDARVHPARAPGPVRARSRPLAAGRGLGDQRHRRRRRARAADDGRRLRPHRPAGHHRRRNAAADAGVPGLHRRPRAARPVRGRAPVRLLLRDHLDALRGDRRRLLRARARRLARGLP